MTTSEKTQPDYIAMELRSLLGKAGKAADAFVKNLAQQTDSGPVLVRPCMRFTPGEIELGEYDDLVALRPAPIQELAEIEAWVGLTQRQIADALVSDSVCVSGRLAYVGIALCAREDHGDRADRVARGRDRIADFLESLSVYDYSGHSNSELGKQPDTEVKVGV